MNDPLALVHDTAATFGFEVVGVTSSAPLDEALVKLESWAAAGHGADLHYMTRDPPQRADARTLLKTVRSVVTVAVNHWVNAPAFESEGRYGRVARYAWGRDYHDIVIPRLHELGSALTEALGGGKSKIACDHSPFLERAAAVRAGLGFFGKNTCLLLPRKGSWYFLGEVLLDIELPNTESGNTDHCGTCTDCLSACPTDAFPEPYVLDARRCISYLTIEHDGPIPMELRSKMGAWIFGCDVCQDVCPFNRFATPAPWPELRPEAGAGTRLDLADTLSIPDDATFTARFEGTPLLRPGRKGVLRNAAIAARNVGATAAVPMLERLVRDDAEPVIRSHALWALRGLDEARARAATEVALRDPDPLVREEAAE